jgi:hypothetical protein
MEVFLITKKRNYLMENIDPNEIKDIQLERWEEWSTMFTNANRGRLINVKVRDKELGLKTLADNLELVAVDYDPVAKGNKIVISFGIQNSPNRHIIDSPSKITQMQNKNGLVASIVIENKMGQSNVIMFK